MNVDMGALKISTYTVKKISDITAGDEKTANPFSFYSVNTLCVSSM